VADRSQSRKHFHGEGYPDPQHTHRPRPLTAPTARSLEYWAQTRPRETALIEGAHALSYGAWNDYADQLADTLADARLGAGDVLALRARTRLEWLVVAMAAAKLDIELLPLDPMLAPGDVRRILIDAGAAALICDDAAPQLLSPHLTGLSFKLRAAMVAPAPGFRNFWDMFPAVARPRFARSQPTTITYTQHLPGELRAVRVPQRRIAPAALSKTPTPDAGVSLITLGAHHAYAVQQIWQALSAGRRMVVMPDYDPLAALRVIEGNRVTQWMDFSDVFQPLAEIATHRVRAFDLSSLRSIVVGGGGASAVLKARLVDLFGPIVSQSFGLPETGLIARLPAETSAARPGTCGRPGRGVVVEIRNRLGQRLPPNAIGEVWARTPDSIERRLLGLRTEDVVLDENDFVRTGVCGRMDEDGFLFLDPLAQDAHSPALLTRHTPIRLLGRPLQR
jgi:long-chain acyl-CoA synthetase